VKLTEPEIFNKKIDEVHPTDYMFSRQPEQVHTISHTGSGTEIDLDDVLSAAQSAAESAQQSELHQQPVLLQTWRNCALQI